MGVESEEDSRLFGARDERWSKGRGVSSSGSSLLWLIGSRWITARDLRFREDGNNIHGERLGEATSSWTIAAIRSSLGVRGTPFGFISPSSFHLREQLRVIVSCG